MKKLIINCEGKQEIVDMTAEEIAEYLNRQNPEETEQEE